MALDVIVDDTGIDVRFGGWFHQFMCFSHGVKVPLSEVTAVRITGWDEPRSQMGWRLGGGYWPGWFATGWYSVPGRAGVRQLWSVFRDRDRLLVIDTRLARPCRLVLAHPECDRLLAEIEARLPPASPSSANGL